MKEYINVAHINKLNKCTSFYKYVPTRRCKYTIVLTLFHPGWDNFLHFRFTFETLLVLKSKYLKYSLIYHTSKVHTSAPKMQITPPKTKANHNCTPPIFITAYKPPMHGGLSAALSWFGGALVLTLNGGKVSAWVGCSTLQIEHSRYTTLP